MSLFIGVDVGGTKVLAAEVSKTGRLRRTATRSTPGRLVPVPELEDALTDAVEEVAAGRRISGVGLAAAGFVDGAGRRVRFAPHLPWRDDPVRDRLAARWRTRVALDNDANCAARAELAYGRAQGFADAVVVTLGTGIGGAVVVDGRVLRGRNGMTGELGHTQVVPDGRPCECGRRGCLEQYSSGRALERSARAGLDDATVLRRLCDGDPERLTGPMVTEAAAAGDPVALGAFQSVGGWLGLGLANLVAALDPDLVVVGGGVSAAGELLLEPARAALGRSLVGAEHRSVPDVVRARFGPEAGVVGGALLAREQSLLGVRIGGSRAPARPRAARGRARRP